MNRATIKSPMHLTHTLVQPNLTRPMSTSRHVCSFSKVSWQARVRRRHLSLNRKMYTLRLIKLLEWAVHPHHNGELRRRLEDYPRKHRDFLGRLRTGIVESVKCTNRTC